MFALSSQPLDTETLHRRLRSEQDGAVVVFEGVIRNRHGDRAVAALEYESVEALAAETFAALETEAIRRFGLSQVLAVHRTGRVAAGEPAVWVGVASPHRDAAFSGCRFVIDELKHRLPIWKKEIYADGANRWVNEPEKRQDTGGGCG